jgi:transposase InsO family protein
LFLIEPGKPNQNAYIESFNGRFREECLNEHWFTSSARPCDRRGLAPGIQRGAAEEGPRRTDPSGLCPKADAKPVKLIPGLQSPVLLKTGGRRCWARGSCSHRASCSSLRPQMMLAISTLPSSICNSRRISMSLLAG